MKKQPRKRKPKLKYGCRSKFEVAVAEQLDKLGLLFEYETEKYAYTVPAKPRKYLIDFKVGDVILEVKGYLDYDDQLKMLLVKEQHPNIRIMFLFQKPYQKLPRRKITHAEWAEKHGFEWTSLEKLKDALKST